MTTVPACSVIIPTYNRADLLARTLDSLVRQDLPAADFEVLVVDDGSSDHTAELAGSYRDRLALRYFFQPDEGWRVAQARNVGITHARGGVCVMVDSGVLLHSGCLQAHLASHERADGPVAVVGYVYGFGSEGPEAAEMIRTLDFTDPDASIERMHDTGRWIDVREPFYLKYADDFAALPAPWIVYWTCNVSAPTERLRAVGGFDEQIRSWGGEDLELAYRLHLDGVRFVLNRAASSIHYPHGSSLSVSMAGARDVHRYVAQKHGTPIIRMLPMLGGALNFLTFNDVATARRLPRCEDYLREQAVTPGP
ncbi:MAG TPA: glycosyltransferase [Jatrophihabitans sp.]|jgi:glycosyltransferase involved in cell wall biosynthesis|uniref:glycosyltransferase n=1 Tax=Jatrophihabitans sp. TaxID=1932789 RepID=UPI002EE60741